MAEVRVKTAALRAEIAEIIQRVATQKTRAVITRYGEPIAVVISNEEAEELDRLRGMYNIQPKACSAA